VKNFQTHGDTKQAYEETDEDRRRTSGCFRALVQAERAASTTRWDGDLLIRDCNTLIIMIDDDTETSVTGWLPSLARSVSVGIVGVGLDPPKTSTTNEGWLQHAEIDLVACTTCVSPIVYVKGYNYGSLPAI